MAKNRFFTRLKIDAADTAVSSWSALVTFYSLMIFLIAIPFLLIVSLVWLNSLLGFSTWIFVGFVCLCAWGYLRLYRYWQGLKARITAQGSELHHLVREATQSGKNIEVSLLNGVFTLRYHGTQALALPQAPSQPLALEGPLTLAAQPEGQAEEGQLPPERLREELAEFSRLRDSGIITAEEFDRIKSGLLQKMSA
jgi:hypothetical protein